MLFPFICGGDVSSLLCSLLPLVSHSPSSRVSNDPGSNSMIELIRDTAFGQLVRLVSGNKVFQYPEEIDPSIWTRFIDEEKSGYLAHHGDTNPPDDGAVMPGIGGIRTREGQFALQIPASRQNQPRRSKRSEESSRTRVGDENEHINNASGVKVDPEKGRDLHLVTWYGPNDPGNHA